MKSLDLLAQAARHELARRRFEHFIPLVEPSYQMGWAQKLVARKLEKFFAAVERGESPRLMVLLPPRHSKSLTVSQLFPAWVLGKDPTREIVVASYGMSLPAKFSRRVREMVRSDQTYHQIFPDTRLHPDIQAVEEWETTLGGGFRPVGRGGPLTGKGADVLIIDDILKDSEEADSPTIREAAMDWYSSTAYTRLYPGAGVIIVMTRWHVEDLAGMLLQEPEDKTLAELRDEWDVLKLPAVAEEDEYVDWGAAVLARGGAPAESFEKVRSPGDALHPERYDERALQRIKATLQPRHWQALYQQEPLPDGGAFFEVERIRYTAPPSTESLRIVIAADTAAATDQAADDSCIMAVGMDAGRNMWVLDAFAARVNVFAFVETLLDFYVRFPSAVTVGIESGPLREAIMPVLEQRMLERGVFLPLADKQEMRPLAAKEIRARPLQGILQTDRLWLPDPNIAWVRKLVGQMKTFPQSSHDDMVDALAWAVRLLLARGTPQIRRPRSKLSSWRDMLRPAKRKTFMSA